MCSNYRPPSPEALRCFGLEAPTFGYDAETYPERTSPFLGNQNTGWLPGTFGLLPHWADPALARHTYNARSETVAEKPSYRHAWRARQLAIVPVQAIYEPCYETGKAVRWRIERADQELFGLAGIWEHRTRPDGTDWYSFSMLTINADGHPLMRRVHKPDDEKRSVVVLNDGDWDAWSLARTESDIRHFLQPFAADLFRAEADPRLVPAKRA
jgi:putative SOS response-associated peptidase YedK